MPLEELELVVPLVPLLLLLLLLLLLVPLEELVVPLEVAWRPRATRRRRHRHGPRR